MDRGGLDLATLRALALHSHPALALARRRPEAALAAAEHAGRWQDPQLALSLERVITGTLDPWEWGALFGLNVPFGGVRAAEVRILQAEASATRANGAVTALQHLTQLDERWVDWLSANEEASAHAELVAALAELTERATLAEDAGALEHTEADLLRLALAAARADLDIATRRAERARADLSRAAGLPGSAELALAAGPVATPPAEVALAELAAHPTVRAAEAALALAEAELEREHRARYGTGYIGAGPGAKDLGDDVRLNTNLPLPLWNRNRAAIARATVERDLAYEALALALADRQDEAERARERHRDANAARARFEAEVLPRTAAQRARLERIAAAGDVRFFLWLEAERAVRDAGVALVTLHAEERRAALALERLVAADALLAAPPPPVLAPANSSTATPAPHAE